MSKETVAINQADVEQLYRRYGAVVERRAQTILGNQDAALDAAQEVFIRVLRSYESFRGDSSPMTWLYRMTTNYCLNLLRDQKRRGELLEELPPAPASSGRRMEIGPDVRRLLQRMPEGVAAAGIYYFVDGMTHEEIAGQLEVSRRTAGNRVEEFRKTLRKRLK